MARVLVVDGDVQAARALGEQVARSGHEVRLAHDLEEARAGLDAARPDIVLLDLELPGGGGLELFGEASAIGTAQVVLLTGHAVVEGAIAAVRQGAADVLLKPVGAARIDEVLARFMPAQALGTERSTLQARWRETGRFAQLWGRSAAMQKVFDQVARVAPTGLTVLVTGESGTGKELVARSLHDLSRRRHGPFLAINCGAISPRLIESELFGHERGAFTGADRQHLGFFERADGGTLFLDEVTEMPPELQVKLLRVLECGSYQRVGSTQQRLTDVRLIAACNQRPHEAVARGALRADLYYRLDVFPIAVPALRDREDDVQLLADRFLQDISGREGVPRRWSSSARSLLGAYDWPGNVRELRNVTQRAYLMAAGTTVGGEHLPRNGPLLEQEFKRRAGELVIPIGTTLAEAERQLILGTLAHFAQRREPAAAALGVSLKTLYNRVRAYEAAVAGAPPDPFTESEPAPL